MGTLLGDARKVAQAAASLWFTGAPGVACIFSSIVVCARNPGENGSHGPQLQMEHVWLSNTARSCFGEHWAVGNIIKLNKLGISPAAKTGQERAMSWPEIIQDVTVSASRPLGMPVAILMMRIHIPATLMSALLQHLKMPFSC